MSNILTPKTTAAFITQLREDGYIEPAENFPAVAEFPLGYIAVVRGDAEWMVTAYYNKHKCWQAEPTHEVDSLSTALALFGLEISKELFRVDF